MVKRHSTNDTISKISKENLIGFYDECRTAIDVLLSLREAIEQYEDGSIDDEKLYDIVCNSDIVNYSNIDIYRWSVCSWLPAVNRYMGDLLLQIDTYNKKVTYFTENFLYLEPKDIEFFNSYTYLLLSGFIYIVYFDFRMFEIAGSDDGNYDIDEIYDAYCKLNCIDPVEDSETVSKLSKIYKFKLAIFDEYPEYEDDFEKILGPYRLEIDEEQLTVDMVRDLINEKISIEDLISLIPSVEVSCDESSISTMNVW